LKIIHNYLFIFNKNFSIAIVFDIDYEIIEFRHLTDAMADKILHFFITLKVRNSRNLEIDVNSD
jgi:hypothetical protein